MAVIDKGMETTNNRKVNKNRRKRGERPDAKVKILLATYQGQHRLAAQLDSFAAQTHQNWVVWASDDGSKDASLSILDTHRTNWKDGRLSVHLGPRQGFVANFLSLVCNADILADYYAFSDQDNVWEADKLERAIEHLQSVPNGIPAVYCTRTQLVDKDNVVIGFSPLFTKPTSFANALVKNIAGGNTMLFNNAARALLRSAGKDIDVVVHDWWTYMVVSGCGGQVIYDPCPTLRYRQHSYNLVGGNSAWSDQFSRIRDYWSGDFRKWNDRKLTGASEYRGKTDARKLREI